MQSKRRAHSKSFKAQVIQECAQLGASIASIVLSHSLNANLVHKWVRLQTPISTVLQPAFIPMPMPLTGANLQAASSNGTGYRATSGAAYRMPYCNWAGLRERRGFMLEVIVGRFMRS